MSAEYLPGAIASMKAAAAEYSKKINSPEVEAGNDDADREYEAYEDTVMNNWEILLEAAELLLAREELDAGDFSCAECGDRQGLHQTWVVTTLDYTDPKNTRTEVCRRCDEELRAP